MKLEQFIREKVEQKSKKYRTFNIDENLHLFFKRTANHYNLPLSDLMFNILSDWKNKHEEEIKKDMINHLR